jgi:UDP-N-acetylmuramoylalanine--D-glutamate ligase
MLKNNLHIIVGLGVTGLSCARYLKNMGIPFGVVDTRLEPPQLNILKAEFPDVPYELGRLDGSLMAKADCLILSPGIALATKEIKACAERGVSVIGDIELFAQHTTVPIIAITGTNAKSTVTTLVGMMAEKAGHNVRVGGNLGTAALDLLERTQPDLFVLELSSFQLETTYSLNAQVASVLNLSPDHMDRYASYDDYCAAKYRIYENCKIAVCNRDDALTEAHFASRKFYFTLNQAKENEFGILVKHNQRYLTYENEILISTEELPVIGKHYQANALAALAMGHGFGLPFDAMLAVLREFKGLSHRCQFVREYNYVRWYDDSKGTNVGATNAAIEGLGSQITGQLVLIAGGVGKNADFGTLLANVKKYVRHVVLIGVAAKQLEHLFHNHVSTSYAQSMEEAVSQAASFAKPHDSVLLSPACASFDMFQNYEHRGRVFSECVKKL